jgi:spermidine synthase
VRSENFGTRILAGLLFLAVLVPAGPVSAKGLGTGVLETDVTSEYSHIRVRRQGNMRSLNFVRDNGEEHVQTVCNLKRPYEQIEPYSRLMFASYLFLPQQKRVLIVGLGGGAMVHFYQHYDTDVKVDVVEIDPKVVELADKYFNVRTQKNIKIITEDAFQYFKENKLHYDAIYMDAFLKPSEGTDATGQPRRLKTGEFYKGLREHLAPEGIVVINLNIHPGTSEDVAMVRGSYPQVYTFKASTPNLIAVGTWEKARTGQADMRLKARALDQRFKATFSFQSVVAVLGK